MQLRIIDAIGPFFLGYDKPLINWSKIPFDNLEQANQFDWHKFSAISAAFAEFCGKAALLGFNAITLDDLAHIVQHSAYPNKLCEKISHYRQAYKRLFAIANQHKLQVLLTSDVMFFHASTAKLYRKGFVHTIDFLSTGLEQAFAEFPEIAGIIFRLGESDSSDVTSDFRSRVVVRDAQKARQLIVELLPIFEKHKRSLVVRTWSIGMYSIGDLIWNRNTFWKVFKEVDSPQLIISMKYGESDFFRFLPLNKIFFYSDHKKIIELQARREYEGFGEFPSFVGWEYERYAKKLAQAKNVVGFTVWCQTGGWTAFRKLTFLSNSSLWNELNTYVSLKIFGAGLSADQAVEQFYKERFGDQHWIVFLDLLKLSDEVIRELLYLDEFSGKKIFFRRIRVPPVIWVYWDRIVVNHLMRKILRNYVSDARAVISKSHSALKKIEKMKELAAQLNLQDTGLDFQYDTFQILSAAREYYLLPFSPEIVKRLKLLKSEYEQRYPLHYKVDLDFRNFGLSSRKLSRILSLFLRDKRGYRLFDYVVLNYLLKYLYPLTKRWEKKWLPDFAKQRALGIKAIFK